MEKKQRNEMKKTKLYILLLNNDQHITVHRDFTVIYNTLLYYPLIRILVSIKTRWGGHYYWL